MAEIKFGTDGWRAVIGKEYTFDNVRMVIQAICDHLKNLKPKAQSEQPLRLVVGYDTRFLSEEFARTAAEVLCGNGIKVMLSQANVSTPATCLAIKNHRLNGGIIITASHNPGSYNGIKYRGDFAGPADPEVLKEIEKLFYKNKPQSVTLEEAAKSGLCEVKDLTKDHVAFMRRYIDRKRLQKRSMKVVIDVMNGAGDNLLANVLHDTPVHVTTLNGERNPYFGGKSPEPIAENLPELISVMKKGTYDIGLATDGDADRIGAVDEKGNFITSHKIMSLILLHFIEDKNMRGSVVKTVSGTSLLGKIAQKYNLTLHETPVGFKYICKIMREEDVLIGGEESGGIGFKNYIPERDGILSGLLLMEMMAHRKKAIGEILKDVEKEYGTFFTRRLDMEYPEEKKQKIIPALKASPPSELLGKKVVEVKTFDGIKFICEDESWLLFRLSGTEPILRIYTEAHSQKNVGKLIELGKKIALGI
jgi:phosphomannomutase